MAYLITDVGVSAARAYSLRKVVSGYSGSAIRVRRSSDDTEQDIGFSGDDLDTASLLSFVGSSSGYVRTWYDQSGNARDIGHATAGNQPRIVNAGTLETTAFGRPCIQFISSSVLTAANSGAYAAGAASQLAVMDVDPISDGYFVTETSTSANNPIYALLGATTSSPYTGAVSLIRNDTASTRLAKGASNPTPASFDDLRQLSFTDSGTLVKHWADGSVNNFSGSYTRSGAVSVTNFSVGGLVRTTTTTYLTGKVVELAVWYSALSDTNRQNGEANQRLYWLSPTPAEVPLVLSPQAPTVGANQDVAADAAATTLQAQTPTVSADAQVATSEAQFVLQAEAPAVAVDGSATADGVAFVLLAESPTVESGVSVDADVVALALQAETPTVAAAADVVADAAGFVIQVDQADVQVDAALAADIVTLVLQAETSTAQTAESVVADVALIAVQADPPSLQATGSASADAVGLTVDAAAPAVHADDGVVAAAVALLLAAESPAPQSIVALLDLENSGRVTANVENSGRVTNIEAATGTLVSVEVAG